MVQSKWWSKMVSIVMEMDKVKIKCSNLEKKKEKNKNQVMIKAKVLNRFLFWYSRHHRGCECV